MRRPTVGASPQAAEATVNRARPQRNTDLRPQRSASRPAGTRRAANTSVYPDSTHDMAVVLTSGNDALMSVKATKRICVSRKTMKIPNPATSRARWARAASGRGKSGGTFGIKTQLLG